MNTYIGSDELYPFYYFEENDPDGKYDVDSDTLARWTRVMDEFYAVQSEMRYMLRGMA